MCGICGYINFDKSKRPSTEVIKGMTNAMIHRGPDDDGIYLKDNVALGQRRLSIIDLKMGHQPMFNEDASLVIVYNGEVYNFPELKDDLIRKGHNFKTNCDTEVVLHAYEEYGENCVKRFNGMYAFAIWDSKKESLFLARDRFGKKPLYYAVFDNQFIFGSELKSLLKHPSIKKEIDMTALSKYLAYDYVPTPFTIFKKIYKLEQASKLILKNASYKVDRYWDLPLEDCSLINLRETEERLLGLLKTSVKKRLISDVPLGVFLSGGMDSSSIVYMMSELMDPKGIKTFSIGFSERSYDELSDARRIADYFGTDHHEEILNPSVMLEVFPAILDILDEPFADSSIIPTYLVSRFTKQFVKVALGGDGGDELFFGYPHFSAHRQGYAEALKKLAAITISKFASASGNQASLYYRANRFLKGLKIPEEVRYQFWTGSLAPYEQEGLFLPGINPVQDLLKTYERTNEFYQKAKNADPLKRLSYLYVNTYLTDDILTKVDRASMANSLEVRAPFLDTELSEFAMSLPSNLKLKGFESKWILKRAFKNKLPKETLAKTKQGFSVPVSQWLRKDLKHLLLEVFRKEKIEREGIFDYNYIKELINNFLSQGKDLRTTVWTLFMFETWFDRWM